MTPTLNLAFSKRRKVQTSGEGQPRLLILDDEQSIRLTLADLFRGEYDVLLAETAEEGLNHVLNSRVSVVLSDERMPAVSGSEFLRRVSEADEDVSRILLTGYTDMESLVKAVNHGRIYYYLRKPWNTVELSQVVASACERTTLLRDNKALLTSLRETNQELEKRVLERTKALESRALELEKANAKIAELALHDPLTGLANRRKLSQYMEVELPRSRRQCDTFCVALCDIDHFKQVNDTWGHDMGDKVLTQVGSELLANARPFDLVVRYGGEEFLIVSLSTDASEMANIAERLRVAVSSLTFAGSALSITASFGVAELNDEDTPESLIQRADANLYRAKEAGRNQVVV